MDVPYNPVPRTNVPAATLSPVSSGSGEIIGNAAQRLGQSVQNFAAAEQEKQLKRQAFDLDKAYLDQTNSDLQYLDEQKTAAPPGAPNFSQNMAEQFQTRHEATVDEFRSMKFDPGLVNQLELRLAAARGGYINDARNFQDKAYHEHVINTAKDAMNTTNEIVQRDPTQLEAVYKNNHDFVANAVDLTADERDTLERQMNTSAAFAAGLAQLQQNPDSAITDFGGTPHETKIDVKTGAKSLVNVVAQIESGNRDFAANGAPVVSPKGARFKMQVMPGTALNPGFGIKAAVDQSPAEYNRVGESLIPALMQKYGNDPAKVLAAYNWDTSEKNSKVDRLVAKHPDNWQAFLPKETRDYVAKGLRLLGQGSAQALTPNELADLNVPPPAGVVADRYRFLSPEQRYSLIGAAQREIDRRQMLQQAADNAAHSAQLNNLLVSLHDGSAGQPEIDNARRAGWLSDYNDIARADNVLAERQKQNGSLDLFNQAIATPGFHWNRYDPGQKQAIDAGVKELAAQPGPDGQPIGPAQAAFNIWSKTGILADTGAAALRGGLISTDPKVVQIAANVAGNMLHQDPNAFAGVDGGSDIEKSALAFNHYVTDLGFQPTQAAEMVAQENTPEYKAKLKTDPPALTQYKSNVARQGMDHASDVFAQWGPDPKFMTKTAQAEADLSYSELIMDNLRDGKDLGTAKAMAGAQLKKVYGLTAGGTKIMKYPPEAGYPPIGGGWKYVYDDAVQTVKAATGHDVGYADVLLLPIPGVTDNDMRSGKLPRYNLFYVRKENGQSVLDKLPKPFYADPSGPEALQSAQDAQNFASRRADQPLRDQMERDLYGPNGILMRTNP